MKFDIIKFLHFETMLIPLWETVYMVAIATLVSLIIGLPIGVLLVTSEPKGVKPNKTLHKILDVLLVNITRSIPFVILIVLLIPLSRLLIGKSFGSVAFIVPLSLGSAPFIARIIEGALKEVDEGLVEASKAMGATTNEIIFKVMIPEALPSLIHGLTLTIFSNSRFHWWRWTGKCCSYRWISAIKSNINVAGNSNNYFTGTVNTVYRK